jgi:hypothetical protein
MTSLRTSLFAVSLSLAFALSGCSERAGALGTDAGLTTDMCGSFDGGSLDGGAVDGAALDGDGFDGDGFDDAGVVGGACGGRAGPCNGENFCDFTVAYDCGLADGTGTCQPRPAMCPSVYMPVCGCDGVTHSNSCEANAAGTDVAAEGDCLMGPDCRTTGCIGATTCEPCRGVGGIVYTCVPIGAVC